MVEKPHGKFDTPANKPARSRWRNVTLAAMAGSVTLAVLGFVIAFLGLGVGFRGHSGDIRSGQAIMAVGMAMMGGSLLADLAAVVAGVMTWRRERSDLWGCLAVGLVVPKTLLLIGLVLSGR